MKFQLPSKTRTSDTTWWEAYLLCQMILHTPTRRSSAMEHYWRDAIAQSILPLRKSETRSVQGFEALLEDLLIELKAFQPSGVFTANTSALAELLGLDHASVSIVRLVAILESASWLTSLLDNFCDCEYGYLRILEFFSDLLEISKDEFLAALDAESPLLRTGVLSIEPGMARTGSMISLQDGLARRLCTEQRGLEGLLGQFIDSAPKIQLNLEDFPHMKAEIDAMRDCLAPGRPTHGQPAHVLLSGAPGTGKTQFALALCQSLGRRPILAPCQDSQGRSASGAARRMALALARHMFQSDATSVLVVDEAENLVESDSFALAIGRESSPSPEKAWMNRFLESDGMPMIWIVNTPDALDPSVLRRFTWTVPFRIPPRRVRRQILDRHLAGQSLPNRFLEELADRDDLPPYEAARLARIGAMSEGAKPKEDLLRLALTMSDRFLGRQCPPTVSHATDFDPQLLNLSTDLPQLLNALSRQGCGRLGFFGPPGTGKSMLAHEIARVADRPLLQKTGANLLGMYVGETEKAIARAFEEASDEGAVLFLDEIDSIAGDRSQATKSWERSQTNELLVRLEQFPGMAIVATNHLDALDPAVARRIDRKIEFRDLRPEQAWSLFTKHVQDATSEIQKGLGELTGLRLGDFAAVLRGLRVQEQELTSHHLLEGLRQELRFRPGAKVRSMGFGA
ncbi:MAG: ATP-binding protein [Fibrobacterota bacterium]|nr:MAG: ATP-binding protein [Fibrobacterota bacterium]